MRGADRSQEVIRTPDQRVRVFVSSTLAELAPERAATREAIATLRLIPVMFELGARPHPPRTLYRAYLEQSDIFIGLYWQRYGWVAPDMAISGLEDEYNLSTGKPCLIYLKTPAPDREPRLQQLVKRIQSDGRVSYRAFTSPEELRDLISNDLALLLTEAFAAALFAERPEAEQGVKLRDSEEMPAHRQIRGSHLPIIRTRLVGRERMMEEVRQLLLKPETGLLTLTGAGGTGKTRIALQLAADMQRSQAQTAEPASPVAPGAGTPAQFRHGVYFAGLAPLSDPNQVTAAIAQVVGVKEERGRPLVDSLKAYLQERDLLLVLDNFEHLLKAAMLVADLLEASPGLKVLATSRRPLRIRGEREYPVGPLQLPEVSGLPDLDTLSRSPAVELFVQRAQDTNPGFELMDQNARAVAEICRRLDGLPLAIELAAARANLLTPQAILSRLGSRLSLLTGGAQDLPARQQALRNTMEWSYELLSEGERRLFRRLSVFAGGRSLEAIEAVCNAAGDLQGDTLDGVTSLLENNLLKQEVGAAGAPRLMMLETIHEYAREKLGESGEEAALAREHALYFMRLAEEAQPHLAGKHQTEWLDRLEDERDNIRAALRWATDSGSTSDGEANNEAIEVGLRIGAAICRFWDMRAHLSEGRAELARLLERAGNRASETKSRARALMAAGILAELQGDYAYARSACEESLASLRDLEDKEGAALALHHLGNIAYMQGDYNAARTLYEEGLAMSKELGEKQGIAHLLNNLGNIAYAHGDYGAARALYDESLAIQKELGDKQGIATAHSSLGYVAYAQGSLASARALHERSLALYRELGDGLGIAYSLHDLGSMAQEEGDHAAAHALYNESLALRRQLGDKWGVAVSLNGLGNLAQEEGDHPTARALHGESLALRREIGDRWGIAFSLKSLGNLAQEEGDYLAARASYEESLTLLRELGNKAGVAEGEVGLGGLLVRVGEAEGGARLLGAAEGLLESTGAVLPRNERLLYEWSEEQARGRLGEELFGRAWQEGRAMSMDEAIRYGLAQAKEATGQQL